MSSAIQVTESLFNAGTVNRLPSIGPLRSKLPSLPNKFCIIGQGQRADTVWTESEFFAICEHMLNGNSLEHFLVAFQDAEGKARYMKARNARADKRANWSWNAITNKARTKTSIGFYASNQDRMTRWGAFDFDAHDGDFERARNLSIAAFTLLRQCPELYLVLCTSGGGGFHLFLFTRQFYPVGEWILLFKEVCQWIGVKVSDGVCEILPSEKAETQRVGKGIRAPGTINPKTGQCSLIEAETLKPLLDSMPRTWSNGIGKVCVGKVNPHSLRDSEQFPLQERTNTYSTATHGIIEKAISTHPILRRGTRNGALMKLIGDIVHKFGYRRARATAKQHYETYKANIGTILDEHMEQFEQAWQGQLKEIYDRYNPTEMAIFDRLRTEHQREAFRIVWAFAGQAARKGEKQFPIARASLADRLSVTEAGASDIIKTLIDAGAIRRTELYQPHKRSALFTWSCNELPRTIAS